MLISSPMFLLRILSVGLILALPQTSLSLPRKDIVLPALVQEPTSVPLDLDSSKDYAIELNALLVPVTKDAFLLQPTASPSAILPLSAANATLAATPSKKRNVLKKVGLAMLGVGLLPVGTLLYKMGRDAIGDGPKNYSETEYIPVAQIRKPKRPALRTRATFPRRTASPAKRRPVVPPKVEAKGSTPYKPVNHQRVHFQSGHFAAKEDNVRRRGRAPLSHQQENNPQHFMRRANAVESSSDEPTGDAAPRHRRRAWSWHEGKKEEDEDSQSESEDAPKKPPPLKLNMHALTPDLAQDYSPIDYFYQPSTPTVAHYLTTPMHRRHGSQFPLYSVPSAPSTPGLSPLIFPPPNTPYGDHRVPQREGAQWHSLLAHKASASSRLDLTSMDAE